VTHSMLVEFAVRKLLQDHIIVTGEIAPYGYGDEIPDALGFASRKSTLIECKASRSDFLSDKKKSFRQKPDEGMGCLRYYLTPPGLVDPDELPENWGLYEVKGGRVYRRKSARPFKTRDIQGENAVLLAIMLKYKQEPDNVHIPKYIKERKAVIREAYKRATGIIAFNETLSKVKA